MRSTDIKPATLQLLTRRSKQLSYAAAFKNWFINYFMINEDY